MKRPLRALFFAAALSLSAASSLEARPLGLWGRSHAFGLGVRVGTPTGLSLKYWFDAENALDLAVGVNHYHTGVYHQDVNGHLDYLWHLYGVFGAPSTQAYNHLPLYFGVGGMIAGPNVAGVRGVAGITWLFEGAPFDLFFDVAPTLVVAPGMGFGVDAGLGGRFYF